MTLSGTAAVTTAGVYRDPSAWYHIVYAQNGASQTLYVNQAPVATGTTANSVFNTAISHQIAAANSANYFDGYLTEVNFIDGQALTPSSFGQIESTTGVWAPKEYVGAYGVNGFYLKFGNTASVAALGTDSSGNGNTWTVNNVSLTAGVTYDSMVDVPANYSDSSTGRGNYAVLNPLDATFGGFAVGTVSNGNLTWTTNAAPDNGGVSSIYQSLGVGKIYWEATITAVSFANPGYLQLQPATSSSTYIWSSYNGPLNQVVGTVGTVSIAALAVNDVLQFAVDLTTGKVWYGRNGTWITVSGVPDPATGTGHASVLSGVDVNPTIGGRSGASTQSVSFNFGQRPFSYTPPSGFRALNTNNLSTPSIVNGANFIAATTYTGNASARSLSNAVNNVSFQPDLVWVKSRTPAATSNALFDSSRGTTKYLSSDTTAVEATNANTLTAFGAGGFSLGTDTTLVNANANSYVAWQWKAGTGAVTNTSGSITSQVNANTTAGFSIVTYTGTGTNNPTIGHGLGVVPAMIILKSRDAATTNWFVYHSNINSGYYLLLNAPDSRNLISSTTQGAIGTSPSSSTFTIAAGSSNSANGNSTGVNYVAYCFAEITGFSKFNVYIGNGSADGPFVFCGFRPRFVMIKSRGSSANWRIIDTSRDTGNLSNDELYPNASSAETAFGGIDILSNGFKVRTTEAVVNAVSVGFIFAAFAEVPSKYALAR